MVQGGNHVTKSMFVFNELPEIYRAVCAYKTVEDPKAKPVGSNRSSSFKCPHCKLRATTLPDLRMHVKTSHSKSLGSPNIIQSKARKKVSLPVEDEDCLLIEPNRLVEETLDEIVNSIPDAAKVAANETPEVHYCEVCTFRSENREDLQRHTLSMHPKRRCNKCEFETNVEEELQMHLKINTCSQRQFVCSHCDTKTGEILLMKEELEMKDKEAEEYRKTIEATEKEFAKDIKMKNAEIKELREKLTESFIKIDDVIQQNVNLKEELKTMEEIMNANEELQDNLKRAHNIEDNENYEQSDEEVPDTEIDEDFTEHMRRNKRTRAQRRSPMEEAEIPNATAEDTAEAILKKTCNVCNFIAKNEIQLRGHMTGHPSCDSCNSMFKTVGLLRRHMKNEHNINMEASQPNPETKEQSIKCDECDFVGKTDIQIRKHKEVRHKTEDLRHKKFMKTVCTFWLSGGCTRGEFCYYAHPDPVNYYNQKKPCFFQNNCRNYYCSFYHFEDSFLEAGSNYNQNFPTLSNHQMRRHW